MLIIYAVKILYVGLARRLPDEQEDGMSRNWKINLEGLVLLLIIISIGGCIVLTKQAEEKTKQTAIQEGYACCCPDCSWKPKEMCK